MNEEKKLIDAYGICQIFSLSHDNYTFGYSVEISGVEIFRNGSLENCYVKANSVNDCNPISSTLDIIRAKQEEKEEESEEKEEESEEENPIPYSERNYYI